MRRIKSYQQLEHSDCGITCIRIVAHYYGKTIPLRMLRELCDVGRMGISLRDIMKCTRELGFRSEAVKICLADVERMPLPAILYWEQRHYVVLYKISRGGRRFHITDPARGKVSLLRDEFMRHWQSRDGHGMAVVMDPMDEFFAKEFPAEPHYVKGLWQMFERTVSKNKTTLSAVIMLAALGMAADVVAPMLFQRTVDDGINGKDIGLLWLLFFGQFCMFFGNSGSYSPYVIKDFSAVIEHGKTTAIVGASGCGKSTLIKLMLGFYVPQKGWLRIGEHDLAKIDTDEWLKRCGVVMQNGTIFSGTILQNIAVAEAHPNVEKARSAARVACIDDFFSSLPMGYHTKLGVAGLELSGGQRQRLFIARAVYKNPAILFLDEATSSLDAGNESTIVENLSRYNAGRTVVIAAHRLSTVRHADKIIFMKQGTIVEQGSHDELVALRGDYYHLVSEQLQLA